MVAARLFLNPDTICKDMNFCTLGSKPLTSLEDLYNSLKMLMKKLSTGRNMTRDNIGRIKTSPLDSLSNTSDKNIKKKNPKSRNITFVHMSDIHLDLEYAEVIEHLVPFYSTIYMQCACLIFLRALPQTVDYIYAVDLGTMGR